MQAEPEPYCSPKVAHPRNEYTGGLFLHRMKVFNLIYREKVVHAELETKKKMEGNHTINLKPVGCEI